MQYHVFKLSPLGLSLLLAFHSGALHATETGVLPEVKVQASSIDDYESYQAPVSRSATKVDAPLRDIPQTVNVVPQALIRDQGAHSMQDVLRNVPGVGLSSGDGQRDQVTIRGFSAIADQFIDGLRDDALYFRDLSNIERVDVLKGPAAVLYGRGSSGGLINRVTKKPGENLGEVTVTVGSWGQQRAEMDIARKTEIADFRITGATELADSFREQQFLNRESLAPSVSLKLGDATLLLQGEYTADRRVTDFGIPAYQGRPVNVDPGKYYGAANAADVDYTQARVKAGSAVLEKPLAGGLKLRNAFRYYDYSLDRGNTSVGSVNEAKQTASLNHSALRRQDDGFFNQTELTQTLATGAIGHQLLYGIEVGRQYKDQVTYFATNVATVSLFDPVLPQLQRIMGTLTTDNLGVLTVSSAYVQDLLTLSSQWKALVGVRYDVFKQETHERRAGQPNLERTDREWSPRAGLVFQPTAQQSYYMSYSKSFQPSGESFAPTAANADLAPEETAGLEFGGKYDLFDGRLQVGAALFRLTRDHIKAVDPTTQQTIPVGKQQTDGVELTLAGTLPGGVQAFAGYAWLDSTMIKSVAVESGQPVEGKTATLTPTHSANLWLSKDLPAGFNVGGGVNYVGDRYANLGNTVTLPAYTTLDAAVRYRIRALDLQLNLNNLTDRRYFVAGHGSNTNLNLPGAPRNAALTARYAF